MYILIDLAMTQEDKNILLKDLCARLPYHDLLAQYNNKNWLAIGYGHGRIELLPSVFSSVAGPCPLIEEVKPYLRPMSSMTEEEASGLTHLIRESWEFYDYLNAHHFDYRGLITMGLALEAPEGMYKTE